MTAPDRSEVRRRLTEAGRVVLSAKRSPEGADQLRRVAQLARALGFGDLELRAMILAALADVMRGDWAAAFVDYTHVVVALERPEGDEIDWREAATCHVRYAWAAARQFPELDRTLAVLDAAEAYCRRRGGAEGVLLVEHARSQILVWRRACDRALPLARRALAERRRVAAMSDDESFHCPEACYVEAVVHALTGVGRPAEARRVLESALRRSPTDDRLLRARGDLHAEAGRFRRALADYDASLALKESREVLVCRAVIRAQLGDREGMRADLRRNRDLDPGDPYGTLWLAALGEERDGLSDLDDSGEWTSWLARYLAGEIDGATLLAQARRKPYADPYVGEAAMFIGMRAERERARQRALAAYRQSVALPVESTAVHLWAAARVRKLERARRRRR